MNIKILPPTPVPGGESQTTRRYLNTTLASIYIGVSVRWLEELRCIGGGPTFLKLGRRKVIYDVNDLDAWTALHRRQNTAQGEE